MSRPIAAAGLLALMASGVVLWSALRWRPLPSPEPARLTHGAMAARTSAADGAFDSSLAAALAAAPFRAKRQPASRRYAPETELAADAVAQPAAPRPRLRVVGYVLTAVRPAVVIDGIAEGQTPALLSVGDSAAGIRLIKLTAQAATLRGFDTTWVLPLQ